MRQLHLEGLLFLLSLSCLLWCDQFFLGEKNIEKCVPFFHTQPHRLGIGIISIKSWWVFFWWLLLFEIRIIFFVFNPRIRLEFTVTDAFKYKVQWTLWAFCSSSSKAIEFLCFDFWLQFVKKKSIAADPPSASPEVECTESEGVTPEQRIILSFVTETKKASRGETESWL